MILSYNRLLCPNSFSFHVVIIISFWSLNLFSSLIFTAWCSLGPWLLRFDEKKYRKEKFRKAHMLDIKCQPHFCTPCFGWHFSLNVLGVISLLLFYFYSRLPFRHFFLMAMIQKNFFVFPFNWIVAHWLCSLVEWEVSLWGYCNVTKDKHFLFFIFYFFTLQYCIGFATLQHESAMGNK